VVESQAMIKLSDTTLKIYHSIIKNQSILRYQVSYISRYQYIPSFFDFNSLIEFNSKGLLGVSIDINDLSSCFIISHGLQII